MSETAVQIAERILNHENTALIEANRDYWVKRIAQSITVAVAAERERCAGMVERADNSMMQQDKLADHIRQEE